jgi:hypothetical protein
MIKPSESKFRAGPLRDALRKADNGDGLSVDMRRVEQNQIARTMDRIEGEDRQVAIVFAAVDAPRNEGGPPATRFPKSWRAVSPVSVLTLSMALKVAEGGLSTRSVLVRVGR